MGTNLNSQLIVREAIAHSFCCVALQSDWGKEVGCLGLDDNVTRPKHAIGEQGCCSNLQECSAIRLDNICCIHIAPAY